MADPFFPKWLTPSSYLLPSFFFPSPKISSVFEALEADESKA
jgi:hypothetical protein